MSAQDWVAGWVAETRAAHPGLLLDARRDQGGNVVVSRIVVPPAQRGRGVGGQVMKALLAAADRAGDQVALTPVAVGRNKGRLERWYRSLGFVANKGRRRDFSCQEALIRLRP